MRSSKGLRALLAIAAFLSPTLALAQTTIPVRVTKVKPGFLFISTGTTWDPNNKGAEWTLSSSNNLATTTGSGTDNIVKGTSAKSLNSGAYYFEVTLVAQGTTNDILIGVADSSLSNTTYLGTNAKTSTGYDATGSTLYNGVGTNGYATFAAGDIVGVAFDTSSKTVWFAKNGVWQNGIPGSSGGIVVASINTFYPAVSTKYLNAAVRINTSNPAYSVPAGFLPFL